MGRRNTLERRAEIARLARVGDLATVDALAQSFAVSPSTIRRDLGKLSEQGTLARTYGGAIAAPSMREKTLNQRVEEAFDLKQVIARRARHLVGEGKSVLLDAGSTVGLLARELAGTGGLQVTTASLLVIEELLDAPGITMTCLGGRMRAASDAFVGPLTESSLERMTFDHAFLGADGVDPELGLCEAEAEQTRLKELMSARATNVYVLAHSSKLGNRPYHAWARLTPPWTLVTDRGATPEQVAAFEAAGVDVVLA